MATIKPMKVDRAYPGRSGRVRSCRSV